MNFLLLITINVLSIINNIKLSFSGGCDWIGGSLGPLAFNECIYFFSSSIRYDCEPELGVNPFITSWFAEQNCEITNPYYGEPSGPTELTETGVNCVLMETDCILYEVQIEDFSSSRGFSDCGPKGAGILDLRLILTDGANGVCDDAEIEFGRTNLYLLDTDEVVIQSFDSNDCSGEPNDETWTLTAGCEVIPESTRTTYRLTTIEIIDFGDSVPTQEPTEEAR